MDPIDILALAARHHNILDCLRNRDYDYTELHKVTGIHRTTLGTFIEKMTTTGLVEKEKEDNRYNLRITRKGLITLGYIDKYKKLIFEPKLSDDVQAAINEILGYSEMVHRNKRLEELLPKKLSILVRAKPEVIFDGSSLFHVGKLNSSFPVRR